MEIPSRLPFQMPSDPPRLEMLLALISVINKLCIKPNRSYAVEKQNIAETRTIVEGVRRLTPLFRAGFAKHIRFVFNNKQFKQ